MFRSETPRWWRFFQKSGPVTVFHVDLKANPSVEESSLRWLNTEEIERYRQYLHSGAQRRFALCRSALRVILCGHLGCNNVHLRFREAEYGKPFALVNETRVPVSFNLSHSSQDGLIALAPYGRLGVDVEEYVPRKDLQDLSEAICGPHEKLALAAAGGLDRIHLFYRIWTIKEALIKALGRGFSLDVSQFEVPPSLHYDKVDVFCFPHLPGVAWRVEHMGTEDFSAAIAHEILDSPLGDPSLERHDGDVQQE